MTTYMAPANYNTQHEDIDATIASWEATSATIDNQLAIIDYKLTKMEKQCAEAAKKEEECPVEAALDSLSEDALAVIRSSMILTFWTMNRGRL